MMDSAGVARAVVIPPFWSFDIVGNTIALQAALDYPSRIKVMGGVDLDNPGGADLEHWLDIPGMLGVRLTHRTPLADGHADWIWATLEEAQIPVMMIASGQAGAIEAIAQTFPGLRLIIDHLNIGGGTAATEIGPGIDALVRLAECPNIAVKISALPSRVREAYPFPTLQPHIRRAIDAFGADRCMWGSDVTSISCPYLDWVRAITDASDYLSDTEKALIMGGTLSQWLNWPESD